MVTAPVQIEEKICYLSWLNIHNHKYKYDKPLQGYNTQIIKATLIFDDSIARTKFGFYFYMSNGI